MDTAFHVTRRYRDSGSWRNPDDQFLRWIRGPLSAGIKNTGGIRPLSFEDGDETAALVLVSNDAGVSQHDDPWEDSLAVSTGEIDYWGDAKAGVPYDESPFNRRIRTAFEQAARGDRGKVPPTLVFRKPEPGVVEFCGLCVPHGFEVSTYRDENDEKIPNYRFHFTILNTDRVPVSWLHQRAQRQEETDAPDEWTGWVDEGVVTRWPLGDQVDDTRGYRRRTEREEAVVSGQFRDDTLARYDHRCAVTGIETPAVLDLAHVLPRSEYPDLVEDSANVLVVNALHHRAFDADLFTIGADHRLRVNPQFDPGHPFLQETIVERAGVAVEFPPQVEVDEGYLTERNAGLAWVTTG
jgi:hypothetical protein